jgi:hypothetical protein
MGHSGVQIIVRRAVQEQKTAPRFVGRHSSAGRVVQLGVYAVAVRIVEPQTWRLVQWAVGFGEHPEPILPSR